MPAVPVAASLSWARRSMRCAVANRRASRPPSSSPRAQMKVVAAPAEAAATAWLKPLPPGPVAYSPASVSPGRGSAAQCQTWSTLNEPATTTRDILVPSGADGGQHAGDGRGHQGRDRAAEHGAQAEARQVLAAIRGEAADAADLDRDRAEVGEAAQRIGRDQATFVAQRDALDAAVDDVGQLQVGDEFVDHHLLP